MRNYCDALCDYSTFLNSGNVFFFIPPACGCNDSTVGDFFTTVGFTTLNFMVCTERPIHTFTVFCPAPGVITLDSFTPSPALRGLTAFTVQPLSPASAPTDGVNLY